METRLIFHPQDDQSDVRERALHSYL